MQNMEKICKLCSNTFTAANRHRLYCTSCNSLARQGRDRNLNLAPIKCEFCSNEFAPRFRKQTVCSRVCRMRVNAKKPSQQGINKSKGRIEKTFTCKGCNNTYSYYTSGVKKYCEVCNLKLGSHKRKVSEVPCAWCGIQFTHTNTTARFCSHSCSSHSLHARGLSSKWDTAVLKQKLLDTINSSTAVLTVTELLEAAEVSEQSYCKYGFKLHALYAELGRSDEVDFASKFEDRVYRSMLHVGVNPVDIITQKTFPDLFGVSGRWPLRYDFFIKSYNILVEADGVQHTQNSFLTSTVLSEHDKRKNEYAALHVIPLVRIPYKPTLAGVLKLVKSTLAPLLSNEQSKSL